MNKSLKQIKVQLFDVLKNLEWSSETVTTQQSALLKFSNLIKIREAINSLDEIEIFGANITVLKTSAIFTTASDTTTTLVHEGKELIGNLNALKILVANFLNILTNLSKCQIQIKVTLFKLLVLY